MNLYNWENSARANHKKAKKTGTVVLHPDDNVETAFENFQKSIKIDRSHHGEKYMEEHGLVKGEEERSVLMSDDTIKTLRDTMGFKALLPGQAQCYRGIFVGRDVILHSRTGSGKTLAYVLPLVERHLLVEKQPQELKKRKEAAREGPFLVIFVFSVDLAVQTKQVIQKVYPKLRVAVAGMDAVALDEKEGPLDILIGTVRAIDEAIRGRKVAAEATAAEEKEKALEAQLLAKPGKKKRTREEGASEEDEDELAEDDDADDRASTTGTVVQQGEVSAANVRAIVIDEVDTTLGPRFSSLGRRMKNLLKYIRHANGSLAEGLLTDMRAHHYVLCGATIPNWVIKAGFLGVKKYYYQLVAAGSVKLPEGLEVLRMPCPYADRVKVAAHLLQAQHDFFGRTIVFGKPKQIAALEKELLPSAEEATTATKTSPKKKSSSTTASAVLSVRTLTESKNELERISAVEDFNSKTANTLLCTDIAARGLDMVEAETVLMLSLPSHVLAAETFVHRAGRTARVYHTGRCLVLYDKTEQEVLDGIARTTHASFKVFVPASSPSEADGGSSSSKKRKAEGDAATVRLQLTVRNPFQFTKPNLVVPSAAEVLEKQLANSALRSSITLEQDEGAEATKEVVRFRVPASVVHEVKEKLWKYKLEELH